MSEEFDYPRLKNMGKNRRKVMIIDMDTYNKYKSLEAENARLKEELHDKNNLLDSYVLEQEAKEQAWKELTAAQQRNKRLEEAGDELMEALEYYGTLGPWYEEVKQFKAALSAYQEADEQPCGHPASAVVSSGEGTSYCGMCERGDE